MSSPRLPALIATFTALVLAAPAAEADVSKAWAAARTNLPATTRAIGAVDVAAAVKTTAYTKLFAALARTDLGAGYAIVKRACKLDPATAVEGLIVAGDPEADRAVVFVQLGLDRARTSRCIEAVMKAAGEPMTIRQDGIYTLISDKRDTVYLAWVAPKVVAVAMEADDKRELQRWIGKRGAFRKSALAAQVARTDTKAIAWGAVAFAKPLDDEDLPVVTGRGALTLAKGKLTGSLRGTFANAKVASAVLARMNRSLVRERASKSTPAPVRQILKTIKLRAAGSEITLDGSATEAGFAAALAVLL